MQLIQLSIEITQWLEGLQFRRFTLDKTMIFFEEINHQLAEHHFTSYFLVWLIDAYFTVLKLLLYINHPLSI